MPQAPYPIQDDETDLFELARKLWQQKRMILGITVVVTLAATVAAFVIPPTYKSEAILSCNSEAAFAPINRFSVSRAAPSYRISGTQQEPSDHNESGFDYDTYAAYLADYQLTPEQGFTRFYKALTAADTLEAAFRDSLPIQARPGLDPANEADVARFYQQWRKNLKINLVKSDVNRIHVTLTDHDPALAATIINDYLIPLAMKKTINDEKQAVTAALDTRKASLLNDIQLIEQRYIDANLKRQDQLKVAIAMAEASGVTKPQLRNTSDDRHGDSHIFSHIFLFGTDALRAELAQIRILLNQYRSITETGQSDFSAPLIPGTAERFYLLQQVSRIKPDFSHFTPVLIEQAANIPPTPEKPDRKLIMAIGLVLGLMLSVFIALIRTANQSHKNNTQAPALSATTPGHYPSPDS